MIRHFKTFEDRMKESEKRGGVPTPVPVPGPDLPWDPAPASLLRHDFWDSRRRCGAYGGSHGVSPIWSATG